MDLPEIQKILLSNTQPKPTQAPPEYLMEIGEYSQVLPRDYLGEARQMADSTAGIMGMAIPYGKLPLKKLKEMYETDVEILGEDLYLLDFDGYDHKELDMSYDDVINCEKRKMGHAFVLAMLLEKYID